MGKKEKSKYEKSFDAGIRNLDVWITERQHKHALKRTHGGGVYAEVVSLYAAAGREISVVVGFAQRWSRATTADHCRQNPV